MDRFPATEVIVVTEDDAHDRTRRPQDPAVAARADERFEDRGEPNGILLELATIPPGFGVDEPMEALGQSLTLPDWLESRRGAIEASLEPISSPA